MKRQHPDINIAHYKTADKYTEFHVSYKANLYIIMDAILQFIIKNVPRFSAVKLF